MKKLIVTDLVWICGSDLASGTSDEKREYMGYDTWPVYPECLALGIHSHEYGLSCLCIQLPNVANMDVAWHTELFHHGQVWLLAMDQGIFESCCVTDGFGPEIFQ